MTYDIPIGCDKITIEQVGNQIITEFIPKVEELEYLDCVKVFYKGSDINGFAIIEDLPNFASVWLYRVIETYVNFNQGDSYTKITREEMQSELSKYGKYFDFEEKVLKSIRWRAKK